MIGHKLAHYEITGKLGEGGMGEVYLARDTRLDRDVALKVLPADLAGSQERLERFRREARALAALDHPGIVTIHAVEEAEGVHFLTMQLVRGQPLSERIPATGMGIKAILDLAIPMADALSVAHAKGITHRDLKPSNVMVDDEGRVKVLDFGLAKLRAAELDAPGSELPTEVMTVEGRIVGTVPYMSPEQAEGRSVDQRSDVFSFGIVLYEMATGHKPFRGETPLSILSAIVRETPEPIREIDPDLPRDLGRIVRRCLEKGPERRYQSTRDLYLDLVDLRDEIDSGKIETGASETTTARTVSEIPHRIWPLAVVGLAGIAAATLLLWKLLGGVEVEPEPEWRTRRLTSLPGLQSEPSLSPDGDQVVFVDYSSEVFPDRATRSDILTQRVGGERAINLTSQWGGLSITPAYSPDGQSIAFHSDRDGGGLFVMGATGENPRKVAAEGFNPAWSPDGTSIAYGTIGLLDPRSGGTGTREIRAVDVESGATRTLATDGWDPAWSPSGARIAFMTIVEGMQRDIATVGVDGGDPVLVTRDAYMDWAPAWGPGGESLYFASNRGGAHNLWRVVLDPDTGEVVGRPTSLTRGGSEMQGFPAISADGRRIAYAGRHEATNILRVSFDPSTGRLEGEPIPVTSGSRRFIHFDLSPNGDWIVATLSSPWEDLVLMSADGSGERKLLDDPYVDRRPRFSHDGERVYFYSGRDGAIRLWSIGRDGTDLRLLTDGADGFFYSDPSPDGRWMSTNRQSWTELFDLTVPYSEQEAKRLPPNEAGNDFDAFGWTPDSAAVLCRIVGGGPSEPTWWLYDMKLGTYRPLRGASLLESLAAVGSEGLYVGTRDSSLVLYDDRTGDVRELLSVSPDEARDPEVSSDGRTIYFLRESASADINLLEMESVEKR